MAIAVEFLAGVVAFVEFGSAVMSIDDEVVGAYLPRAPSLWTQV